MRSVLAVLVTALGLLCCTNGVEAATIDFHGNHHNMGILAVGQNGAIDVNRVGSALGEVTGYLPGNSMLTIEYTITGVHSASLGSDAELFGAAFYNFINGGTHFYGYSSDKSPQPSISHGWTTSGGTTTSSLPLVLATADIVDSKHGTVTIYNYSSYKAFFVSLIESWRIFGHVVGQYTVSALGEPAAVPLPASSLLFMLAMAGMLGVAYRRKLLATQ